MKPIERMRLDWTLLKTVSFWSPIGLSLLVLTLYILSRPEINLIPAPGLLEIIEAKTLDLRFRLRGPIDPGNDIVIIAVDEKTEDELGRWHSSGRQWLATLLNILHEGNARVIGFDLTLAEPDSGIGTEVLEELKDRCQQLMPEAISKYPAILTALDELKTSHGYDRQLTRAIQQAGNVVLGMYHFFEPGSAAHLTPEKQEAYRQLINRVAYTAIQFPPGITSQPLRLPHSIGVEPNLPAFSEAAKSFGHFDVISDRDDYIRFSPLLVEYQGDCYPSLALEAARWYLDPPLPPVIHALGKEGGGSMDALELADRLIPCNEEGKLLINYYGPKQTFLYYSLSDVILGRIPCYKFADKIVLVGFTSIISQDFYSVPFQKDTYPGVEINATIIANILREDFLTRPKATTLIEAGLIFLLGLILGIIRHRKSPLWGVWAALFCLLAIFGFAYALFLFGKIWFNVTFLTLFIVVDYLTITSYKYFTEEKQKRDLKNAFQHYVSPAIVTQMLKNVEELKLGGARKHLTALFSDIQDFTPISEQMAPEKLVEFLNEYFSEMTKIVLDHGGTVDKYIGDAIMAFYGAPVEQPDHAARACKTAVDMLLRLRELQVGWEARGLPPINIRVGINSGDMSVGNMGSRERFDYTIMGDHVNLASRLEGINKSYGTNIIISQFTYNSCQECQADSFTVRELDTVRVKGKNASVMIYELIGYGALYQQRTPLADKFCEGLEAYKHRQWEQALTCFQEALQLYPHDEPSQIYIERCTEYLQHPPPEDWDGVFEIKTK